MPRTAHCRATLPARSNTPLRVDSSKNSSLSAPRPLPNESVTQRPPRQQHYRTSPNPADPARYRTSPEPRTLHADTVTERVLNSTHSAPTPLPNESETPTTPCRYRTSPKLGPLHDDTVTERVQNSTHSTPTSLPNESETLPTPRQQLYRTNPNPAETVTKRVRNSDLFTPIPLPNGPEHSQTAPTPLPNMSETSCSARRHRYRTSRKLHLLHADTVTR